MEVKTCCPGYIKSDNGQCEPLPTTTTESTTTITTESTTATEERQTTEADKTTEITETTTTIETTNTTEKSKDDLPPIYLKFDILLYAGLVLMGVTMLLIFFIVYKAKRINAREADTGVAMNNDAVLIDLKN